MDMENFQVRVVFSSSGRIACGPCLVSDIIQGAASGDQFIVQRGDKTHLLLFSAALYASTSWSSEEAELSCIRLMQGSSTSIVLFYKLSAHEQRWDLEEAKESSDEVLCLSILGSNDPASSSFETTRKDNWPGRKTGTGPAAQHFRSLALYGYQAAVNGSSKRRNQACLFMVLIFTLSMAFTAWRALSGSANVWRRYDIGNSVGPRYQLQFTHHNVSSWSEKYQSPEKTWFVRIDDQSMVPMDLVDERELQYQQWFRERYPEADSVRQNGLYLQESFLSDYHAIQVPADKQFHMAHCVLALKRYYWAKESGKHVCPRDIDSKHIQHCVDALDSWAFPEGPRTSTTSIQSGSSSHEHHHRDIEPSNWEREQRNYTLDSLDNTRLVWRTKVCFDDDSVVP